MLKTLSTTEHPQKNPETSKQAVGQSKLKKLQPYESEDDHNIANLLFEESIDINIGNERIEIPQQLARGKYGFLFKLSEATTNSEELSRASQDKDSTLPSDQQVSGDNGSTLPQDFIVGQAIGDGDCFFDSVAQGLKQIKSGMGFTIASLRKVCKELIVNNQQSKSKVIKDARNGYDPTIIVPGDSVSDDELWNAYLASIEYTSEDIRKMKYSSPRLYQSLTSLKYGSTIKVPVWGRPDIEGQMICKKYNIKLHIIEKSHITEEWLHQIIDESGSKSTSQIDYNDVNMIHI